MNTIYENNLKALKQKNEKLWEAFYTYAKQQKESRAFTAVAKNGEVIIGYHGKDRDFNLNSTYNPSKEAEKLMAEYDTIPDNAFLCMYGLANGIFAKRFLECNPHGNAIYVYEPDLDIFMTAMQEIDLTELLNNNRFFIAVESLNTDDFGDFLLSYISEINELTNRYMALPIYQTRFPEGYDRYKQIIKDKYEYYRIQTNTLIKVGKQIGLASISNMQFLPNCRSGADYKDYFPEDVPAIIVAAGPSLQKNVDLLKKAKGKAITIVVDSAINTVMAHGVMPDFVITVDTNKELKNFTAEGLADVFFLADATANTAVLDMVKPKNLVFYSTDSGTWSRMFSDAGSSLGEIFAGGSVALDAMALAIDWGFKRIIMIGQDLAMTGNKQYADGENLNQNTSFNSPTLYVKDIYGNDVLTKKDYYTFIRSIEDLAYRNPDIDFIDATEGGALKRHTRIMTLQQAIDQYCKNVYNITEMIEAIPRRFATNGNELVKQELQKMKENIELLITRMREGAEVCDKAAYMLEHKQYDKDKLRKINEKIRILDEWYADMEEHKLIKKVTCQANHDYETTIYLTEKDSVAESIRIYKNSAKLYIGIADGVADIIKTIEQCEKEI